ncbi:hypothetical protein VIGAN_10093000 [Vigna angularis var. angularis]|uniref:Secreted protein n=1 Tax=Vigna angularis var. angularis TaxID=157739 RepID=A0A0S3T3K8_PHAAN|nr:hypothetical protein VIGAN_10093000 [Vigna angularis var. angularis]
MFFSFSISVLISPTLFLQLLWTSNKMWSCRARSMVREEVFLSSVSGSGSFLVERRGKFRRPDATSILTARWVPRR